MSTVWEPSSASLAVLDQPVLVLNRNYLALTVCRVRRAVSLVLTGKAELLVPAATSITTSGRAIPTPAVIRVDTPAVRLERSAALSGRAVFARDGYVCQYCRRPFAAADLTLDHVIPRHQGGARSWENLVTACRACNHRKAGLSLVEARMKTARAHYGAPRVTVYSYIARTMPETSRALWQDFLPADKPA